MFSLQIQNSPQKWYNSCKHAHHPSCSAGDSRTRAGLRGCRLHCTWRRWYYRIITLRHFVYRSGRKNYSMHPQFAYLLQEQSQHFFPLYSTYTDIYTMFLISIFWYWRINFFLPNSFFFSIFRYFFFILLHYSCRSLWNQRFSLDSSSWNSLNTKGIRNLVKVCKCAVYVDQGYKMMSKITVHKNIKDNEQFQGLNTFICNDRF